MSFCTPKCQKWTLFSFGAFFLVVGIVLAAAWMSIVHLVEKQKFNVGSEGTTAFKFWKDVPIPMYIEFYLYNWTNWKDVVDSKWSVKPNFYQMGPYTYLEKHTRENIVFNHNHTVTYQTNRTWHFLPEKSGGSPDDQITTLNPVLVTVGNIVRFKHAIVKMGVNFFITEKRINLTVTKSAREFIFDGYEDPLLDLLKKLHVRGMDVPFTKFGWFAERNGSASYDGTFNMFDGTDDIRNLGKFTAWNFNTSTKFYPGYCGDVNGTSGELWYPVHKDPVVQIFSPDICSTLTLIRDGDDEQLGIDGNRYIGLSSAFDNGSTIPDMACFSPGEVIRSGLRNVSECKWGAPAFISYPHFYLADPYYREVIDGMHPNVSEHQLFIAVEPETGVPLKVQVAAQISLRLQKIDRVTILENVKELYLPALWFKQYASLDEDLASQVRTLLVLIPAGPDTGYGLIGLGVVILSVFGYLTWKKKWQTAGGHAHLEK